MVDDNNGQNGFGEFPGSGDGDGQIRYDMYTGEPVTTDISTTSGASMTQSAGEAMPVTVPPAEVALESLDEGAAGQASSAPQHTQSAKEKKAAEKAAKAAAKAEKKAAKRGIGGFAAFLLGLFGAIVGSAVAIGVLWWTGMIHFGTTSSGSAQQTVTINASSVDSSLPEAVAAKALPSVVSIDVYSKVQSNPYGPFGSMGGGGDTEAEPQLSSLGSGVIISTEGYILTNYHVIDGGSKFVIHFDDDSSAEAKIVGTDESSDLAVLKVDKEGLTAIDIADSSTAVVGEWVMAIGSPFGNDKSVSAGIVSALYRSTSLESTNGMSFYINMIQTDAAINPGNSGGALVNADGALLGINTLIDSYSGSSSGVGFAIPSNYAMNIANQIIESGEAAHPYLGCTLGTVDASTRDYYNTDAEYGAYVGEVIKGSPAEKAGLKAGDIVIGCDGKDVTNSTELIIDIRAHNIGDTIKLTVLRGNDEVEIEATLASDND